MDEKYEIADRLGIADVFALRRVSEDQLVNLVGVGRGEGWAGNISIDPDREPLVAAAMGSRDLIRHGGESIRIFGPYWTEHAAIAMVGDFVVVLGGAGVAAHDDVTLIEAAGDLAWAAGEVSPEKRLADELEVTKAALSVASLQVTSLEGFLADLADAAIEALSCEFGAVVLCEPSELLVIAPRGWRPEAPEEEIRAALLRLVSPLETDGLLVAQDLSVDGLADSPIGFADGLISRCVVPIRGRHLRGAVVVAHTTESPRGFTLLCQQVAARIGDQASQVLGAAAVEPSPNR